MAPVVGRPPGYSSFKNGLLLVFRLREYGSPRTIGNDMDLKHLDDCPPFTTKDGSEIRELLAYRNSTEIKNQSLAEARLPAGAATDEHYHARTEEIYFITHGCGRMRIEGEERDVKEGDAVAIPPGAKHKLWNTGVETLRLLCCCSPAYEHSDTIITES